MQGDHSKALSRSLDALAGFVAGDRTLHDTLQRVSELGLRAVEGADMTGVTLLDGDRPTTAVSTDPTSPRSTRAVRQRRGTVPRRLPATAGFRIDSTSDEERWVEFCRAAAAKDIHSVLSLPMSISGHGKAGGGPAR